MPLLGLGGVAIGAAIYHESPGCAALGALLVLLPLAAYFLVRRSLAGVTVERVAPPSAFVGETVRVRVLLTNGSRLPLFQPRVHDLFSPALDELRSVLFPERFLPGETQEVEYEGSCDLPRGVYHLGPLVVTLTDPFGWVRLQKTIRADHEIKVYPQYFELALSQRSGEQASSLPDELARRLVGESTELFAVRDYRPGDPLRRIHWGLTAHRGFPVVREHTRSATGDLCLFLDLSRKSLVGLSRASSLEQSVKLAASAAAYALRRGLRVELVARGSSEVLVPRATGRDHLGRILDALVRVRADGEVPLEEVLETHLRRLRPGTRALIPVSPDVRSSETFLERVFHLRRVGVDPILVVFDESTYQNLYELAATAEPVEAFLARLRLGGVQAVRVTCNEELGLAFRAAEAPLR